MKSKTDRARQEDTFLIVRTRNNKNEFFAGYHTNGRPWWTILKSTAIHYRQIGIAKVVMGQINKKHGESLNITNSGSVEEIGC